MIPRTAGVYRITNTQNGKFYIGSTKNLYRRWNSHKCLLNKAQKGNSKLKAAWRKYGATSFVFEVIAKCPEEYLIKLEQWFIDNLNPHYNTRQEACASNRGIKHTSETLKKVSEASKRQHRNNPRYLAERNKKPILCYDSQGNFLREYDSAKSAAEDLSMFPTNITRVLKGQNYLNNGYHFRYKNGDIQQKVCVPHKKSDIEIIVLKDDIEIGKFKNIKAAGKQLSIPKSIMYQLASGDYTGKQYSNIKVQKNG
jgi:predicted RNA binding protein YcfA (HicA-like mRNA interferase family)